MGQWLAKRYHREQLLGGARWRIQHKEASRGSAESDQPCQHNSGPVILLPPQGSSHIQRKHENQGQGNKQSPTNALSARLALPHPVRARRDINSNVFWKALAASCSSTKAQKIQFYNSANGRNGDNCNNANLPLSVHELRKLDLSTLRFESPDVPTGFQLTQLKWASLIDNLLEKISDQTNQPWYN